MNCPPDISRRHFLETTAVLAFGTPLAARAADVGPQQIVGVRAGEVTDSTAVIWTRLTRPASRNAKGVQFFAKEKGGNQPQPETAADVADIEGACSGMAGRVRMRYALSEDLSDAIATEWSKTATTPAEFTDASGIAYTSRIHDPKFADL